MKKSDLAQWIRANGLADEWWVSLDGKVSPAPQALDAAVAAAGGRRLYLCHISKTDENDWWPVDTGPPPVPPSADHSPFGASAAWRKHPASDRQKEVLRFFREPFSEEISKGQASEIIDTLFSDPKKRDRWDRESERREDKEFDRMMAEMDREFEEPRTRAAKPKQKKQSTSGCGCLLLIILAGVFIAALFLE